MINLNIHNKPCPKENLFSIFSLIFHNNDKLILMQNLIYSYFIYSYSIKSLSRLNLHSTQIKSLRFYIKIMTIFVNAAHYKKLMNLIVVKNKNMLKFKPLQYI